MFGKLIEILKKNPKKIVFTEGNDPRILEAASRLLASNFLHPILVGNPEEIAKVIAPQFKETDLATITTIVSRYYKQDTWKSDLIFKEESFNLLQDILESSGELKERVPYEELVTTTFAEKAAKSSR